jgi:hypothetical protein
MPEFVGVEQRDVNDCLVACLATVLELPYSDVPSDIAYDGHDSGRQSRAVRDFLDSFDLTPWTFQLHGQEKPLVKFGTATPQWHLFPPGCWLATVKSPRTGLGHVVVMRGAAMLWDPHPKREEGHHGYMQAMILMAKGPA